MMHDGGPNLNRNVARTIMGVVAAAASLAATARAEEDALSPPAALEFPFQATPDSPRGISVAFFRAEVEKSADLALCQVLMKQDGKPMPAGEFEDEDCLPEYRQKVASNSGAIHWASGARPISCANCIGRPFMSAEGAFNRPNLRRAMLYGRLEFTSETGPNRNIVYPFEGYFTCKAENGARSGSLLVDVKFGQPVIGDPGWIESTLSFFSANTLSDYVEWRIRKELSSPGNVQSEQGACRSVGAELGGEPKFDLIKFDPASASGAAPKPQAVTGALHDSATIKLIRLTRNPLPAMVAPEHGHPGDPFAGQFSIFSNGAQNFLPPQGLMLPPEGGSVALNFCKTVDLTGANRLQLLFTNDLGGAVWSDFTRAQNFGAGVQRKMTTGRTIILPVRETPSTEPPGPPPTIEKTATKGLKGLKAPTTGPLSGGNSKPTPFALREFELTYEITFNASPSTVGASAGSTGASSGGAVTGGAGSTAGAKPGSVKGGKGSKFKGNVAGALGKKPEAVLETAPQQPCVQL